MAGVYYQLSYLLFISSAPDSFTGTCDDSASTWHSTTYARHSETWHVGDD